MPNRAAVSAAAIAGMLVLGLWTSIRWPAPARIRIDPVVRYQTLRGWEATAQAGQVDCPGFPDYREALFDRAVQELGINRLRLELRSGSENPKDWFTEHIEGRARPGEWKQHWYDIENDNSDPHDSHLAGYQFSELDYAIEQVALPLKQRLERQGEKLFSVVTYVDFDTRADLHRRSSEEYAELVLATYRHMADRYGFAPDAWEVVLEPDNSDWTGEEMGRAMVASAKRLRDAGFDPSFIVPSTTHMSRTLEYLDAIARIPGALEFVSELSYHRYGGVSRDTLSEIGRRAQELGVATAMLEKIRADYTSLYEDLTLAGVSAWQQYTLAFCSGDDGAAYFFVEKNAPDPAQFELSERGKFLRPYFRFARRGAQRIGATSNRDNFEPVAFQNPDGGIVVVVKGGDGGYLGPSGGRFEIEGLPAGEYRLSYTTPDAYEPASSRAKIQAGEALAGELSGEGVFAASGDGKR